MVTGGTEDVYGGPVRFGVKEGGRDGGSYVTPQHAIIKIGKGDVRTEPDQRYFCAKTRCCRNLRGVMPKGETG